MSELIKRFNLQLFAEPGDGGGAGDPPAGAGDPPADASADPVTLTPAELEAKLNEARQTASRAALTQHYKSLGMSQKEAEKLIKGHLAKPPAGDPPPAAPSEVEQERDGLLSQIQRMREDAALLVAATAAGFIDPADALPLVNRDSLAIDDNGAVTGAQEAMAALVKAKPHLVKQKAPPYGGAANPGGAAPGKENLGVQLAKGQAEQLKKSREALRDYTKR